MRLQVQTGQACNAQCPHCEVGVGLFRLHNYAMSEAMANKLVDRIIERRHRVHRVTLAGGEPLLNKDLQGIIYAFDRLDSLTDGRVLTNDLLPRDHIDIPPRWHWVPDPIDDPEDVRSGKAAHVPFFISPADHGIESKFDDCRVRGWCGRSADKHGFAMCGVAPVLGRLLKIDPYDRDDIVYGAEKPEGICQHCIYGLSRKEQRKLTGRAERGEIAAISPTYQAGIERERKSPTKFDDF